MGPPQSKKQQSEATRTTLINTGARLFALHGYHGVSMRTLASEAGVNIAAVSYHFGGKTGLYEAILQAFIDIRDKVVPTPEEIRERMAGVQDDPFALAACVDWFVDRLVRGILTQEQHSRPAFIISRELAQPTELHPKLERDFIAPSQESLRIFTSLAMPGCRDREEVIIVAHCVIAMIIKFLEGAPIITSALGWNYLEGPGLDKLAAVLCKRMRGFLGLPMENPS